ncbi:MAG: hypothetical protein ACI9XO_000156 [Paraglaciecola sp.]|jgi:hypothetical protein
MKKNNYNLQKIFQNSDSLSEQEIKNYLQNNASDEERFRVENTLIDSPLDADAVEGFQENNYNFSQKKSYGDFQYFLEKLDSKEAKVIKMKPRQSSWRRLAIAASFLLLVAFGGYLYSNMGGMSNDELFAAHYGVYENDLPSFRGDVEDQITVMQTFEKAMEEYSNGNYAASLPFFEEYMTSEPDSHFAMFYSGLAYLETDKAEEAVAVLEKAAAQDDNYQTKAQWFLILAHLKNGNKTLAQEQLDAYLKRGLKFKKAEAETLRKQLAH